MKIPVRAVLLQGERATWRRVGCGRRGRHYGQWAGRGSWLDIFALGRTIGAERRVGEALEICQRSVPLGRPVKKCDGDDYKSRIEFQGCLNCQLHTRTLTLQLAAWPARSIFDRIL